MVNRTFNRGERVGGQVHKVLADLVRKGLSDPRLAQATITGVKMNRDLRIAKVYFACHGKDHEPQDVLKGFESAKGYIKRELARELGLRYMPDLQFYYDASFDYGAQINRILQSIKNDDEENNPTSENK